MPELPDITLYIERLEDFVSGTRLESVLIVQPFLLRTVEPGAAEFVGRTVRSLFRLGKRIVIAFDDDYYAVLHLMIAGRLQWKKKGFSSRAKNSLATFEFEGGTLWFTEAGSKRRASLHLVRGEKGLEPHRRDGIEVFDSSREQFVAALTRENRTLKRALTDPRLFSGIGNAYSDEILFDARLSPMKLTRLLTDNESDQLFRSTRAVLQRFIERMRREVGDGFPAKVTAFRPDMAVHGRFREPCTECGKPIQRIRYASNECNYCAACQNAGRLLADRSLSRLLKKDWPKTLDELENL